jgi:hypothetical protein
MDASVNKKRRKEYLDQRRKRQNVCKEKTELKEPFVRMKRKETMTQKTVPKRIRKVKDVSNEENESEATNVNNEICDFGKPTFRCKHCDALQWYEERLDFNKQMRNPKFGICCKNGKFSLPATKQL